MTTTLIRAPEPRSVHPDVPTDRAWKIRTRLYVSSGPHTQLRSRLEAMGAHWDTKRKAHWVGPAKHPRALDAVLIADTRSALYRETIDAGHWLTIPFGAELIRERAKTMGAVWEPTSRHWAAPTAQVRTELLSLCEEWTAARARERAHQRLLEQAAQEEAAIEAAGRRDAARRAEQRAAEQRRDQLIAGTGRTPTGEYANLNEASDTVMTKEHAAEEAHEPGDVLRLKDGRRAVVTRASLRFMKADAAGRRCAMDGAHTRTHWCYRYRLAVVQSTEAELNAEVERGMHALDAADIHQLMLWAPVLTQAAPDDRWSTLAPGEEIGRITAMTGVAGVLPAGHLILTRGGQAVWQHPGEYDTYIRAEGTTSDPDLLTWARAVLADGPRTRVTPGRPPVHYAVTTRTDDA